MSQPIFSPTFPALFVEGTVFIDGDATTTSPSITARQLVAQNPRRARVFEKYGISYCCCSGNKTFFKACAEHQTDPQKLMAELAQSDAQPKENQPAECEDWSKTTPARLRQHLVSVHHVYLRNELVRLSLLVDRVATQHGVVYNELWELQSVFEEFREELGWHLERAENQFFPLLELLENSIEDKIKLRLNVGKEICTMELEHAYLSNTLICLIALTKGYCVPTNACNSFKVMLLSLEELAQEVILYLEEERYLLALDYGIATPTWKVP